MEVEEFNSLVKVKECTIIYPDHLEQIEDRTVGRIAINVTLEDGITFPVTVATPSYYKMKMEQDGKNYYSPGVPDILVKTLTKDNIKRAIEHYTEDEHSVYWLQLRAVLAMNRDVFTIEAMNSIYEEINNEEY